MNYRSDIDGLRAIAVLSVILFHINNALLPGGFVGVDIFFVISGYLITGIIAKGLFSNTFSMTSFYSRRIKRIFPALFTVLLFSTMFVIISSEPIAYERFFKELRFAALQTANFVFSQEVGYFDAANETSPLLHTWSLGVEEQFYLIWPLLIAVMYKLFGKHLFKALFVVTLGSFFYSDFVCSSAPQIAFFMLSSRAWELGLGGLLAISIRPAGDFRILNTLSSFLGISLLVISFFVIGSETPFPGRWALLPSVGAALIIYSGNSRNALLSRLLSFKPFVFIGKISYSLYLWHWPVIVFYKQLVSSEITLLAGIFIFSTSLILALISYYLVEKPCRFGKYPRFLQVIYAHYKMATIRQKAVYALVLLVVLPFTATKLLLYSNTVENNPGVTSVEMQVEVLQQFPVPPETLQ